MVTIPYARSAPYDRDAYVARMADLMLRRGDVNADALRRDGDARAQQWANAGNVVMAAMAQYGAIRDSERKLALEREQQRIENSFRGRQLANEEARTRSADAERASDLEWRRAQFRDQSARNSADDLEPGSEITPDDFTRDYAGTSAARRFERRDASPELLPARPLPDGLPLVAAQSLDPNDELSDGVVGRTMSRDTAARPERYERVPNWQERVQAEELSTRRRANELSALNTIADNRRADEAARATAEYRRARLAQGTRDRQPTQASLALAAARGDAEAQKALDIIRRNEGGRSPQQIQNFMTLSGQYQKSPLVAAADRTVVLKDAINAIREAPGSRTAQMSLAYSFIQALDTYQSAVREGELQNLGAMQTVLEDLRVKANRIYANGSFMSPTLATDIASTSQRLVNAIDAARQQKALDFGKRARVAGVGDMWDAYALDGNVAAPPPPGGGDNWFAQNAPGSRKK